VVNLAYYLVNLAYNLVNLAYTLVNLAYTVVNLAYSVVNIAYIVVFSVLHKLNTRRYYTGIRMYYISTIICLLRQ